MRVGASQVPRKLTPPLNGVGELTDNEMIYAIGDIHGRSDLLAFLLTEIESHAAGRPARIIFLGDYIDRGPDSAGVVRMVRELASARAGLVHCLMGNHEQMLLLALEDSAARACWLDNGGTTTLESFKAADAADLPADVIRWFRRLPTFHEDAKRYFVHAGLDPASPLNDQTDADRLWIREPFISADHDFGKHVVHGHTPVRSIVGAAPMPDEREHRTNIDTGAVFGGALTAAVFDDRQVHPVGFLQVQQDGFGQFLSSRRQVLDLMTRLSGNAQKPVVAAEVAPSRRIAASVLILGLAGTGIALASMNWSGGEKLAAARPVTVASSDKARAPVAAPKPAENRNAAPGIALPVTSEPAGGEQQARADEPALVQPAPRPAQPDMAQLPSRLPDAPAQSVIASSPPEPIAPRIAQDQVATRPEPAPEPVIAAEAAPTLPSISQDQIATRPEPAPEPETAMAQTPTAPVPDAAPEFPRIAQDQPSTQPVIAQESQDFGTSVAQCRTFCGRDVRHSVRRVRSCHGGAASPGAAARNGAAGSRGDRLASGSGRWPVSGRCLGFRTDWRSGDCARRDWHGGGERSQDAGSDRRGGSEYRCRRGRGRAGST